MVDGDAEDDKHQDEGEDDLHHQGVAGAEVRADAGDAEVDAGPVALQVTVDKGEGSGASNGAQKLGDDVDDGALELDPPGGKETQGDGRIEGATGDVADGRDEEADGEAVGKCHGDEILALSLDDGADAGEDERERPEELDDGEFHPVAIPIPHGFPLPDAPIAARSRARPSLGAPECRINRWWAQDTDGTDRVGGGSGSTDPSRGRGQCHPVTGGRGGHRRRGGCPISLRSTRGGAPSPTMAGGRPMVEPRDRVLWRLGRRRAGIDRRPWVSRLSRVDRLRRIDRLEWIDGLGLSRIVGDDRRLAVLGGRRP